MSADRAAAALIQRDNLRVSATTIAWLEYNPEQATNQLWCIRDGEPVCLTRSGFSIRSSVNGYGGGAMCLHQDTAYVVEQLSQQVFCVDCRSGRHQPLSSDFDGQFGGLTWDPFRSRLLAVREHRDETAVAQQLVAIDPRTGKITVLAQGEDFYGAPVVSAEGGSVAWITWSLPDMPWVASRLWRAELSGAGEFTGVRPLDPPKAGSVQQPRFDDNALVALSDHEGWWQPFVVTETGTDTQWRCLESRPVDHANAPWQLSEQHSAGCIDGGLAWVCYHQGYGELWWRGQRHGRARRLLSEGVDFRSLQARGEEIFVIVRFADALDAVVAVRPATGAWRCLAGGERPLSAGQCILPQAMSVPVDDGQVPFFYYSPRGGQAADAPVIVRVHGGPTSAAYASFDPQAQFWGQRGFAVVDVNYRGSSGAGRDCRMALAGRWGELDVADVCRVVDFLDQQALADGQRAFIQGRSAGGFTVLMAMLDDSRFRAGASLFGVSDPMRLRAMTHRFESGYLDWLLGDPVSHAQRWQERTPATQGHRIWRPVIFFQGGQDKVVVPEQTHAMVSALEHNGQAVRCHVFPEEGHGFRRAARQAFVLQSMLEFYRAQL